MAAVGCSYRNVGLEHVSPVFRVLLEHSIMSRCFPVCVSTCSGEPVEL